MRDLRYHTTLCSLALLACGAGVLTGCGGTNPSKSDGTGGGPPAASGGPSAPDQVPKTFGPAPQQKARINTFKTEPVYVSDPAALDKMSPGKAVTVDGRVILWEDKPSAGEKVRYVRLAGYRKTNDPAGRLYYFDCALPDGTAGFEGLRLMHAARVRGTVEKTDTMQTYGTATPTPRVVLRDCKLESVTNGTVPPPRPVIDAIKGLQGKWRVARIEGGDRTPQQYGVSEIWVTDCNMIWTASLGNNTRTMVPFGMEVDPGKTPGQMNLHPTGYHMIPALYEQQGDALRLCVQLPLDPYRENTRRPKAMGPDKDGVVVIVAERMK